MEKGLVSSSPNLGVYLVSCLTEYIGGRGSGELSHQIRVSIWRVASLNTLVEEGQVSCLTKSGCLFGELPHRIHWWKRAWWVVSPNLGVYLVRCLPEYIGRSGSGELSHKIWAPIWQVASPNTLVEGSLGSCITKSGRPFGELPDRIHWWKGALWVVSPNLGVYLVSWVSGELSHQVWASIWWVASPNTLVEGDLVSCLTKSGRLFGEFHHRIHWWNGSGELSHQIRVSIWWDASPNTLVEGSLGSCITKSGRPFGELPHRIHWWKGALWVVSPNLGVYLVSWVSGELSHQVWASIWWVSSSNSLNGSGELSHQIRVSIRWDASPTTLVERGLVSCLFGELHHRIHWWKGVWWIVLANLGIYLVSCLTEYIGGKGSGELSHPVWASIWWVASPNTLVEGDLVSCLTKFGRLFGELLHRMHVREGWTGIWWAVSPNLGVYLVSCFIKCMKGGVDGDLMSCLTESGRLFGELPHHMHVKEGWRGIW